MPESLGRFSTSIQSPDQSEQTINHFYEQMGKGQLVGSTCNSCGALFCPPISMCTKCYGSKLASTCLSAKGKITTFTIVHVAPPELEFLAPYVIVVVRLLEGPSLLGILKDARTQSDVEIGSDVVVDFMAAVELSPGTNRVVFAKSLNSECPN